MTTGANLPPQVPPPEGVFLADTVEIGRPFQYALSIRHRASLDVLFPDTARAFKPFRVRSIDIFPTVTDARGSLDSAVYTLVSFETVPVQVLQVPVFMVNSATDCTTVFTRPDTVLLKERIRTQQLDTLRLATDTQVIALRQQMNYPLLLSILVSLVLVGGLVLLIFGRTIRARINRYRLYRQHADFQRSFNRLIREMAPETAYDDAGRAMVLWKEYMEWLERKPYTSLTTREIVDLAHDERLTDALKEIDGAVYGGVYTDQTVQSLRVLQEVADSAYRRRSMTMEERS